MPDATNESPREIYERLVVACEQDDIPAVEQCVCQLLKTMQMSAARLGVLIGLSDQTVLRWMKHNPERYAKAKPRQKVLEKIEEVISSRPWNISFNLSTPAMWSPAHLRAVANTDEPCKRYLDMLLGIEQILGTTLDEELCTALLRKVEEKKSVG